MHRKAVKDVVRVAAIGVAYYFVHTTTVGIAAAIPFPDQFAAIAQEYTVLSFLVFTLMTKGLAAAISALLAGFAIARFLSSNQVWWGVAIIVGLSLYSALTFDTLFARIASLRALVRPGSVFDVPMIVAWWTFLPISIWLFVRRFDAKTD